jgi:hypothetical protein
MRKWRLPLTYQPKVEPVLLGTCRQTIRTGRKKQVGDLIRFFLWTGRPYWSKQINLTEYEPITSTEEIRILPDGITWSAGRIIQVDTWHTLNWLAGLDSIVPPTGEALRDVLIGKNGKIPVEGIEAQILRW